MNQGNLLWLQVSHTHKPCFVPTQASTLGIHHRAKVPNINNASSSGKQPPQSTHKLCAHKGRRAGQLHGELGWTHLNASSAPCTGGGSQFGFSERAAKGAPPLSPISILAGSSQQLLCPSSSPCDGAPCKAWPVSGSSQLPLTQRPRRVVLLCHFCDRFTSSQRRPVVLSHPETCGESGTTLKVVPGNEVHWAGLYSISIPVGGKDWGDITCNPSIPFPSTVRSMP